MTAIFQVNGDPQVVPSPVVPLLFEVQDHSHSCLMHYGFVQRPVMPGSTKTESFSRMVSSDEQAEWVRISPLQRLAEPGDVADVVAFLVVI